MQTSPAEPVIPVASDITQLVSKSTIKRASSLRDRFASADPFPHVAIDNFLTPAFAERLVSDFPQEDDAYQRFCVGDDGKVGANYANGSVAEFPPAFKELDLLIQNPAFLDLMSRITGIEGLEYDADYFGGGIRESKTGTFLPAHVDFNYHPRTLHHRRLNLLLYFNKSWSPEWGGNLQVHRNPRVTENSLVNSYSPEFNRALIFETSEISWHAFDRLAPPPGVTRRAFTIYYYTKDRPGAADIEWHNTEYVEPPIPPHLAEGYQLTAQDLALLREGYARRDQRIDMLYAMRREADGKYSSLWKEYEYYLDAWRKATGQTTE